jgi:hypothetical protein
MADLTEDEAITRARKEAGVSASTEATAWRVERIDYPGNAYFLVIVGKQSSPGWVGAIEAHSGQLMSSAQTAGLRPHLGIDRAAALAIANIPGARTRLVWRPCQASMSALYPLWEVAGSQRTAFVDQQGKCWDQLPSGHG